MELKKILKNTGYLSVPKVFNFLLGVVRAKINALYLGTEGVGVISQIQDSFNKISELSLFSTALGTTKLISQSKEDNTKVLSVVKTSLFITIPVLLTIYLFGLIFSSILAKYFLGTDKYNNIFLLVMFFFPFLVLKSFPSSVLQGYLKIKYLANIELIIGIVSFILYIPLVIFYKLNGAIVNYSLIIMFTFLIFLYFAEFKTLRSLNSSFRNILSVKYDKNFAKEILSISGIWTFLVIVSTFSEMGSRLIIVNVLNLEKIGIYTPVLAWSSLFTGFIFPAASSYLTPRFAELKINSEIVNVLNDGMRVITFIIVPFVFLAIPLRKFAIPLFYSEAFFEAEKYLPIHFIGLIIFIWQMIFTLMFVPTGRIIKLIPFSLGTDALSFFIILYLTPVLGLWAISIKSFIVPLLTFTALYIYLKFEIKFTLNNENKLLFIYSVTGGFIIYLLPEIYLINLLTSLLLILLMYFILKKSEKNELKNIFNKCLKN